MVSRRVVKGRFDAAHHDGAQVACGDFHDQVVVGHFAAMEQPQALAADIREFFRSLRGD